MSTKKTIEVTEDSIRAMTELRMCYQATCNLHAELNAQGPLGTTRLERVEGRLIAQITEMAERILPIKSQ